MDETMKAWPIAIKIILINLLYANIAVYIQLHGNDYKTILKFQSLVTAIGLPMIGVLLFLFKRMKSDSRIFIYSLIGAFVVPVLTCYGAILHSHFYDPQMYGPLSGVRVKEGFLIKAIPLSLVVGIGQWVTWVPIGIFNSLMFYSYNKQMYTAETPPNKSL
jgi:hypothetical protein